jgi:hypothetical protein
VLGEKKISKQSLNHYEVIVEGRDLNPTQIADLEKHLSQIRLS